MSELKTLTVQKRDGLGKGPNRRLRMEQTIPCVFYGTDGENVAVQVPAKAVTKMFSEVGRTTVFNLEIEDNGQKTSKPCLFWDVQFHPYKRAFTHIDFYGVALDKDVKLSVPLDFVGVARGTKLGGTLETYRERITVKGKPLDIPARVAVDISDLDVNVTMHVGDIVLPKGVSISMAANYAVVSVLSREAVEAEEAAAGAAS